MKKKLVFLHGWINKYIINREENIFDFYKELVNCLKEKFDVEFIILPGFSSNKELERPFTLDDYVEYVKKYLEEKGIDKFYLMGHSFGGQIACKFTYLYPEKVEKLIIYNGACVRKKSLIQKILSIFKPLGKTLFTLSPFCKKVFYKIFTGSTDYLKLPSIMQKTMQNVISEDLTPILPEIKTETILIWGKKDKITPLKNAYIINKLIKNSKLIICPQGGHSFHKTYPQFIADNILI